MKVKTFLFSIVFLFYFCLSFGQGFLGEYVSRAWTAADGLPGNTVTDLIQDRKGYIYIGTYDGLVRFDGVEFVILNRNTMSDFKCVSARVVYEDTKGNIWVGSNDEGVAKINKTNITMTTIADGLPNNSIRGITEDKFGNIWIGTASGIVFITPEGKIETPVGLSEYNEENMLVVTLYCDTAGRVWVSNNKNDGVYYYASGKFNQFTDISKYENAIVTAISQDSTGAFWFGLNQGIALKFDEGEFKEYDSSNSPINSTINYIYQDSFAAIWFGTEHGIVALKDGEFSTYTEKDGLTNNSVTRILEDREGNMWIATDRGGVEKMSPGKFRTYNLSSTVNCIAEDKNGLVWIGTDADLLCYRKFIPVENDLTKLCKGIRIRHIEIANNGDLLVSTYKTHGQIRYDYKDIKKWTAKDGLTGDKVRVAIEDDDNNLYVGTTTGLNIIDSKTNTIKNYTSEQGLNNDYIMCLLKDKDNCIWAGTDGGGINLLKNGEVIKSLTTEDGLAGNVIFKITQSVDGNIWICTGTGISRYDGKNFFNYSSKNGLGTDSVFQILIDYTGAAWMTSNRGISSLANTDMDRLYKGEITSLYPKFFNKNDGLRSGGITSTSVSMCDSIGRIWFTLIDGFAIYDPVKVKSNTTKPLIHIENVKIDNEIVIPNGETIILEPGTKRIEIKYTGLSFVSSEMVRFRYQMNGFDSQVSDLTSARAVSYTNLAPGNYVFKVQAANSDGIWSQSSAQVSFKQKAFYYQRISFWIAIILIIIVTVFLILRLRLKHQQNEQLRLETMVQMKTVDLEIEKDNSDRLLLNVLPKPIAERLKSKKESIIADKFTDVSVLFADIVGFTKITSGCNPEELVTALNDLFSRFDKRAIDCGVEKIKTIGDSYMAVCGLPTPNKNHASILIKFACGMFDDMKKFNANSNLKFEMRIGINSGEVVAGVIGKSKFIYDLWGDTVNVASRMESSGKSGFIHVSECTKKLVLSDIEFYEDEQIEVKGKGLMKTCFVKSIKGDSSECTDKSESESVYLDIKDL